MRAISLAEANKIIEGTFASAKKRKAYALAAIVLDAGGRMKAFQKQDGAVADAVRDRLWQGVRGARAQPLLAPGAAEGEGEAGRSWSRSTELADGPMFLEAGGQLVRDKSGEIVGALGVTGDVNEVDDLCAMDGIRAAGFLPDDDFDAARRQAPQHQEGPAAARPAEILNAAVLRAASAAAAERRVAAGPAKTEVNRPPHIRLASALTSW